jgi:two-component system, chemotaxis family, chemotaxis protein CheY
MRILIVDDSSMMRAVIKRVVRLTNVPVEEILEAGDARQALSLLELHDVQLLLTDINMPGMSGADLLRVVAADQRWRHMTRVVISTDGSAARRAQVAGFSVRAYLEKPFSPEVLRDVLTEAAQAARL